MCVNDRRRAKRRGCQERSETERPEGEQGRGDEEKSDRQTRLVWKKDTPAKGRRRKRE